MTKIMSNSSRAFFLLSVAFALVACDQPAKEKSSKQAEVTTDEIAKKLQQATEISPADFLTVLDAAKKGDYQSQRNLAYGYAAHPYPGQEKNRVLGCAWYLVIANSGSKNIVEADISNANVYCGTLEHDLLDAAKTNANLLMTEVYGVGG